MTLEILRPVPIAPLTVSAEVVRPGRTVELLSASLSDGDGEVIRASAWRIAAAGVELPGRVGERPTTHEQIHPAGPQEAREEEFFPTGQRLGYHRCDGVPIRQRPFPRSRAGDRLDATARWRWSRGRSRRHCRGSWSRADSGNGVSAALDWTRYLFVNVDLSVHLHRMPVSDWVCLDAVTVPEPTGIGIADAALRDERGPIGRALQTLVVRERDSAA